MPNVYSKTWACGIKPTLTVFNKIDGLTQPSDGQAQHEAAFDTGRLVGRSPGGVRRTGQGMSGPGCFCISAKHGIGIDPLLEEIARLSSLDQEVIEVEVPLDSGELMAWLRRSGTVIEETYTETGVQVATRVSAKVAGQLKKRLAQTSRSAQV